MHRDALRELLERVARGELSPAEAGERLAHLPFVERGEVVVDTHRPLRTGEAEAVYCEGKTPQQAATAFLALSSSGGPVLATRASDDHARAIVGAVPSAVHHPLARMVVLPGAPPVCGDVAVICAGTSDLPVAEEAAVTAESLGAHVGRVHDAGVAGLHRLLSRAEELRRAGVVIAVAGMEGALPSVVAGLVSAPVVAVPTSVGYGAAFGGLAALLAMLNACAPGVAVVNIDNGFGAGLLAVRVLRSRGEGL
ncbi:MAG TPA: nickel pincer cofactor biosynthesis protein LarB [Thermoanaerobaculaceae bacterium]|nr:nickel pincer cofactor biosynthesis protein LarB [Thermoanaerobaculaceae bacterium]